MCYSGLYLLSIQALTRGLYANKGHYLCEIYVPVLPSALSSLPVPVLSETCLYVSLCMGFTLKYTSLSCAWSIKSHCTPLYEREPGH